MNSVNSSSDARWARRVCSFPCTSSVTSFAKARLPIPRILISREFTDDLIDLWLRQVSKASEITLDVAIIGVYQNDRT